MRHNIFYIVSLITVYALAITNLRAVEPYTKKDGSWITISGTAVNPTADSFTLDYGEGIIKVEMDDYDVHQEGYDIRDGNRVIVSGRIDDNFYNLTTIEAGSVYDQDRNQFFYASSKDDELWYESPTYPIQVGKTTVRGTVASVNPDDRVFTIATGKQLLTIDTWGLGYNPLDDYGYQRVDVGDRVSVSGTMTRDFMSGRQLDADLVVTIKDLTYEKASTAAKDKNKEESDENKSTK